MYDPTGTYSQHAGVTITSIFENTKSKIIVHLLHDDTLTEDNKRKFICTAEKYNQTIELIDVTNKFEFNSKIEKMPDTYRVTIGTYYRLLIPDLLPKISKVLYFDCDIIFDLDVQELWNVDAEDYCIAGVFDIDFIRYGGVGESVRCFLMRCDRRTYINAGVLIMNLNMIRNRGNLFQNAMNWLNTHAHLMKFSDQDILNCLFYKSIKIIDHRFNNIRPLSEQETRNSIIHASGHSRAWEITGIPYQKMYWKTYLISEWGKDKTKAEIIDLIVSLYAGRKDKWQLWFERIKPALQKIYWSVLPIKYIFTDIYHKLKYKLISGKRERS